MTIMNFEYTNGLTSTFDSYW